MFPTTSTFLVATISSILLLLSSPTPILAQTPPSFTPSTTANLGLAFGNTSITPGQQIGINVPALAPTIFVPAAGLPGTYLFLLVDPDAPSPANPNASQFLHWLQPSITFPASSSNRSVALIPSTTNNTVPYTRPAPPPSSPAHRYIALLFAQPANFSIPAGFRNFSATARTGFNASGFARAAGLGNALRGNYFLVSNATGNGSATATGGSGSATGTGVPVFRGDAAAARVGAWMGAVGVVVGGLLVL